MENFLTEKYCPNGALALREGERPQPDGNDFNRQCTTPLETLE